jgi:hypothetical protein
VKHHVDFFRSRLVAPIGRGNLQQTRVGQWVNSSSANLAMPPISVYPITLNSLVTLDSYFASEGAIFAAASLESMETVRTRWVDAEDLDGLGCRLVALYYSAFYAAHAVLRFLGISLTNVTDWKGVQNSFINYFATPAMPKLSLRSGYHRIVLSSDKKSVEIFDADASSNNGSHGVTWKAFKAVVDSVYSNNYLNTEQQKNAAAEYVGSIATPLTLEPGGHSLPWPWMSPVRNQINYRLPEVIWGVPKKRITPSKNKDISGLIKNPSNSKIIECATSVDYSVRFAASCVYAISILGSLINDMEQRADSKKVLPRLVFDRRSLLSIF